MQKILLLHGAIGAKEQLIKLAGKLSGNFEIHTLNFSGHGGREIPSEPFSMDMFARDIISYLDDNKINEINIFGYSMGGYAALHTALNYPGRIGKIFTLATKFEWTTEIVRREVKMLDAQKIKEKVPKFAEELAGRHGEDKWEIVLAKTREMMLELGKLGDSHGGYQLELDKISNEVLIGIGDRDKMVSIEETVTAYKKMPNSQLLVMPGTPHPLEQVNIDRLSGDIGRFFV